MKTTFLHLMLIVIFFFSSFEFASGSLSILNHTPSKSALNILPSANIVIQFSNSIDTVTLTNTNIRVNGSQSGLHPFLFTYNPSTSTVTINPNTDFTIGETIEVTITRRVKSTSGDSLAMPLVWRFTIRVPLGFTAYTKDTSFALNNPIGGILCDVDNDGDLDEVISSHDAGTITIYKNNGNGKFSYFTTLTGGGLAGTTYPPVCGDFNGDGYIDVAATVRFSNLVSVWFNNGNGTFSPSQQLGTDAEPDRINVADYNGDGYLDMAVRCHSSSSYYMDIFINDGTGHFTRTQRYPLPARLHVQCSGDFNGDGAIDIAFATHDANLHILFNNGNGVFSESVPVIPNIHDYINTADFDGDGKLDLVVNNPTGFAVLKNNGFGVFSLSQQVSSTGNSYGFKVLRDINADGFIDIIVPNWTLNREEFYINDGTGHFTLGYTIQGWSSNNSYEIDAGDLNGNGNLDLAGPDAGSFVVYLSILPLPSAPVLVSPANGSTGVLLTPNMDWNDVTGAVSYRLQLSADSGFSSITFDTSGISASQINVPPGKLSINTTYYWRVNATNSNGTGNWSAVWKFATLGLPGAPVLVSPANNSSNVMLTPTFIWNNVPTATSYKLQLSIDSNCTTFIFSDSTLTQNFYVAQSGLLTYNTTYYWRVNAKNSVGTGNCSPIWKFTTIVLPGAPVLVSPANNSVNLTLTPTFLWNNVSTAINYKLQLSVDSTFTTSVLSDSTLTQNYYMAQSGLLANNTKYYWRVGAKNSNGWGAYSAIWNFRTVLISEINNYKSGLPDVFKLHNNFPNPFNPITKIRFDIPRDSRVEFSIFDISGKEISKILNKYLKAGFYEVQWNGDNCASGVYFYRIVADDFRDVKKMILIK